MFRIILSILLLCVRYCKAETVTVLTTKGAIQGFKNDGYNTFFGVPYAKVNEENPFGNSVDIPNFDTPFYANYSSIICPQVIETVGGILQCLRLNIYMPHTASTNNALPILVWFHGGGFGYGSAGDYGGQHLTKHGIFVITVNYRLGPYGFLCLDDRSVPGNQGLKDQITALQWVKKNIAAFGGDASKVTIAGESYGGGGVDLHLYSKYETLFNKAIIESGSIYSPGFFVKHDYNAAVKLATQLGHTVKRTQEALKILAKEDPIAVMTAAKNSGMKLAVCKERRFIKGIPNFVTKYPLQLHNPDRIKNTKIMIGYNSKEAFGTYANKPLEFYDTLDNIFYKNLRNNFILKKRDLVALSDIIKTFYLGDKDIGSESMLELSDYTSDFKLNYAAEKSVNKYIQEGAKVYKYLFSYIGGSVYKNVSGAGATHKEELKYLFEMSVKLTTDEQKLMRERMTAMWANFVKHGNPTPQNTELLPVTWDPVENTARPYLNIDVNMTMQNDVYQQRIAFWELFWQAFDKKSIIY